MPTITESAISPDRLAPTPHRLRRLTRLRRRQLGRLFDTHTHLHRITQPTLFLQGTADPLTGQVLRYVPLIRHAQLRLLPGLHHVPVSDDPAAVADQMLTFLRDAPEPRRTQPT